MHWSSAIEVVLSGSELAGGGSPSEWLLVKMTSLVVFCHLYQCSTAFVRIALNPLVTVPLNPLLTVPLHLSVNIACDQSEVNQNHKSNACTYTHSQFNVTSLYKSLPIKLACSQKQGQDTFCWDGIVFSGVVCS